MLKLLNKLRVFKRLKQLEIRTNHMSNLLNNIETILEFDSTIKMMRGFDTKQGVLERLENIEIKLNSGDSSSVNTPKTKRKKK